MGKVGSHLFGMDQLGARNFTSGPAERGEQPAVRPRGVPRGIPRRIDLRRRELGRSTRSVAARTRQWSPDDDDGCYEKARGKGCEPREIRAADEVENEGHQEEGRRSVPPGGSAAPNRQECLPRRERCEPSCPTSPTRPEPNDSTRDLARHIEGRPTSAACRGRRSRPSRRI